VSVPEDDTSTVPWRTLSSRPVYANPWISVREDRVELPDGRTTVYGVVTSGECVGTLPFVDDDHVLLVRQYRYVFGRPTWEMPTGGMHAGETPPEACARELAEEAAVAAGRLEPLATIHTSKSVLWEIAHLFSAHDLTAVTVAGPPDDTEFLHRHVFRFADVVRMVERSEILDAMTVVAVLHALRRREHGGRPG
jgi:ADP-ribose pyrophosphatase